LYEVPSTRRGGQAGEIQWKYNRNKPSKLGEIVNGAISSTYFTKQPAAAGISIIFPSHFPLLFHEAQRSLFPLYFYCISPARRGGYFYYALPAAAGISQSKSLTLAHV